MLKQLLLIFAACAVSLCGCDSGDSISEAENQNGGAEGGETEGGETEGGETEGGETEGGTETPSDEKKPADACRDIDLMTSHDNCGQCGYACGENAECIAGDCMCRPGFSDCDADGVCETEGECVCVEGDSRPCYTGSKATRDVGECRSGVSKCVILSGLGAFWDDTMCEGQVLPSHEYRCDPSRPDLDVDCNGVPDAVQDGDGDGYSICNAAGDAISDCCDNSMMCNTARPDWIHPGRAECDGNGIDDNCDGNIDDSGVECSKDAVVVADCKIKERSCSDLSGWKYGDLENVSRSGAYALAQAFDVCLESVTEQSGAPGLIEYSISPSSDYHIGLDPRQFNIKDGMYAEDGTKLIAPRVGGSFVILSSGIAGDAKTELAQHGLDDVKMSLGGSIPEPYRTAHKNQLQTHPKCASGGADIYDSVRLHLKIRAPETARGISFDFRFFSREYPYFVCSKYNDFFLSILTDEHGKPLADINGNGKTDDEDGNISFDMNGNPVSVNNAFFTTCAASPCNGNFVNPMEDKCPAMISCDAATQTCGGDMCKDGTEALAAYYPQFYTSGADPQTHRGGGTAWLTTKAPVRPGEIFNLDFYIWDTGDLKFDSSVILDNFQWECGETKVETGFATEIENIN